MPWKIHEGLVMRREMEAPVPVTRPRLTAEEALSLSRELSNEIKGIKPLAPRRTAPLSRRERFRALFSEDVGKVILACYSPEESNGRRRWFRDPEGAWEGTTADMVQRLEDLGLVTRAEAPDSPRWTAEDDSLQVRVGQFLIGHGFQVRQSPRDLGEGNQNPNRKRFRAKPADEAE